MAEEAAAEDITEPASAAEEQSGDTSPEDDSQEEQNSTMLTDPPSPDSGQDEASSETAEASEEEDADSDSDDGESEAAVDYEQLTIPDGIDIDEAAFGKFKELAQTMNDGEGLSNADAQKIVDMRVEMVKSQVEEWEQTFSEWRGEIFSDKSLGGDNFESQTIPNVMAAAERYGDKEMIQLLKTNKMYGENPSLIRLLNRVGETLREDQHTRGRPAGSDASDEEAKMRRMFPSHYQNKE